MLESMVLRPLASKSARLRPVDCPPEGSIGGGSSVLVHSSTGTEIIVFIRLCRLQLSDIA